MTRYTDKQLELIVKGFKEGYMQCASKHASGQPDYIEVYNASVQYAQDLVEGKKD